MTPEELLAEARFLEEHFPGYTVIMDFVRGVRPLLEREAAAAQITQCSKCGERIQLSTHRCPQKAPQCMAITLCEGSNPNGWTLCCQGDRGHTGDHHCGSTTWREPKPDLTPRQHTLAVMAANIWAAKPDAWTYGDVTFYAEQILAVIERPKP